MIRKKVLDGWVIEGFLKGKITPTKDEVVKSFQSLKLLKLDPFSLGIIIVGPWRGKVKQLNSFRGALKKWQKLTGWPILADPLSGVENDQEGLINHWDLFFLNRFI